MKYFLKIEKAGRVVASIPRIVNPAKNFGTSMPLASVPLANSGLGFLIFLFLMQLFCKSDSSNKSKEATLLQQLLSKNQNSTGGSSGTTSSSTPGTDPTANSQIDLGKTIYFTNAEAKTLIRFLSSVNVSDPALFNSSASKTSLQIQFSNDNALLNKSVQLGLALDTGSDILLPPMRIESLSNTINIPFGEFYRNSNSVKQVYVRLIPNASSPQYEGSLSMTSASFNLHSTNPVTNHKLTASSNTALLKYLIPGKTLTLDNNDQISLSFNQISKPLYFKLTAIANGTAYTHASFLSLTQPGNASILGFNLKNGSTSVASKPISEIQISLSTQDSSQGFITLTKNLIFLPSITSSQVQRVIASTAETDDGKLIFTQNTDTSHLLLQMDANTLQETVDIKTRFPAIGPLQ